MTTEYWALFENRKLIDGIEANLSYLGEQFDIIKSVQNQTVNDERFNRVIDACLRIFDFVPLLASELRAGEVLLFRARHNSVKNKLFNLETEVSYNSTRPDVIGAGRFNRPVEAVFYASIPFSSSVVDASLAACLETCKGLTAQRHPVNLTDFTVSTWNIEKSLHVMNLCLDEAHLQGNPAIKHQHDQYRKAISECLNAKAADFIFSFLAYFSEMSGRRSPSRNEYYILTAMFFAVRYYYGRLGTNVHGLIYPSAMTEKKGLNLVLTSEVVDAFLQADRVGMFRFFRDGKTFIAEPCCDLVKIIDGKFEITGFRPIPVERRYTRECENEEGAPLKESK